MLGIAFLLLLDDLIVHLHADSPALKGSTAHLKKATMTFLAVTLHNIPKGDGDGCALCRGGYRRTPCGNCCGFDAPSWDCRAKLPRRGHRVDVACIRRRGQGQGVRDRAGIGCCGGGGLLPEARHRGCVATRDAICCRCDDLCCHRGAHPPSIS